MSVESRHVMLDLETLGTSSSAPIIAIGAVKFGVNGVGTSFYAPIDIADSIVEAAGVVDGDTIKWWMQQSDNARNTLFGEDVVAYTLEQALGLFKRFLFELNAPDVRIWGNGADFDNVILANAYIGIGREVPWKQGYPFMNRCYRTMKNQFRDVKMDRVGTHHNALDDARSQASHLLDIIEQYGLELG